MTAILQQVQQHAAALPLALQAELLNYAIYLEQKAHSGVSDSTRKQYLAEALEQAAALNPFSDISDPLAWQREQRQDRPLPGRNHAD